MTRTRGRQRTRDLTRRSRCLRSLRMRVRPASFVYWVTTQLARPRHNCRSGVARSARDQSHLARTVSLNLGEGGSVSEEGKKVRYRLLIAAVCLVGQHEVDDETNEQQRDRDRDGEPDGEASTAVHVAKRR